MNLFKIKNINTENNFELPPIKNLFGKYINIAIPAAIEGVFLNIATLIDLAMVGILGKTALAAVGISSQPKMALLILSTSIGTALTAIIARRKGEKDYKRMNDALIQTLFIIILIYIPVTIIVYFNAESILRFAGAKDDYINEAVTYYSFIVIGIFFKSIAYSTSSALTAIGNTKELLYANTIGNISNVFLNWVLIFGKFGFAALGIKGAAIATMLSDIITLIFILRLVLRRNYELNLFNKNIIPNRKFLKVFINLCSGTFFATLFERVGYFVFGMMVARLGTSELAVHHVVMIICDVFYFLMIGCSKATMSVTGQSLGAKRYDLAKLYVYLSRYTALGVSILFFIIMCIFRVPILKLLIHEEALINLGKSLMIINAISCIPIASAMVNAATLRGAGDNKFVAMYILIIVAVLRPIITYLLAFKLNLGLNGVWFALVLDHSMRLVIAMWRVNTGTWMYKKV